MSISMKRVGVLCENCGCYRIAHFQLCEQCGVDAEYCDCDEELDDSAWTPPEALRCECGGCSGYRATYVDFSPKNIRVGEPVVLHSDWPTPVECVWSPDGLFLAALVMTGLEIWESNSWKLVHTQPLSALGFARGAIVWSPRGDLLAVAEETRTLLIETGSWVTLESFEHKPDSRTREELRSSWNATLQAERYQSFELTFRARSTYEHWVSSSPDGSKLAEASDRIRIFDSVSGRLLLESHSRNFDFTVSAWHPGDNIIAAGDVWAGGVWLFDAEQGLLINALRHGWGVVRSISFSAQGDLLASGATDGTTVIWDIASGARLQTIQLRYDPVDDQTWGVAESADEVLSLAWSPDGSELACGSSGLRVWPIARSESSS